MKYSTFLLLVLLGVAFVARPILACGGGGGEGEGEGEGEADDEGSDEGSDEGADEEDCDCQLPDEEVNEHCKSKLLKGIMEDNYAKNTGDLAAIQDGIQADAVALFGGEFEVVCTQAPGDLGFRNWYSEGKICKWPGDELVCLAWRD